MTTPEAKARIGVTNTRIAEMATATLGRRVDDSQVARCISLQATRRVAPIDLVEVISDLFDVPRPVMFAASLDEARRFKTQRKITGLHEKQAVIVAESRKLRNQRQDGAIQNSDEEEPPSGDVGVVAKRRRKTPPR